MNKKIISFLAIFLIVGLLSSTSWGLKDISIDAIEKKYTNNQSKFIDIDGTRVHYRDEGKGPILLLIHGIFSSVHTWDGWTKELSNNYRIVRLDMPSWGLTGAPNFENTKENYINFLEKFTKKLNLKKFSIAGNSLGGYFAWKYASTFPKKVDKLILLDPAAYPQNPPFPLKLLTAPVIGNISTYITPKFIFTFNIKDVYGDTSRIKKGVLERYYQMTLRKGNRESAKKICEFIVSMSTQEPVGIKDIKAKTLLMWGEEDRWIPIESIQRWKKDLPSVSVKTYKGVGHIPMEEIPIITAKDARKFLEEKRVK